MTEPNGPEAPLVLPRALCERLVTTIRDRLPRKSFGYLISDIGPLAPVDFVLFEANIRNDDAWRGRFESYGRYFVEHADAGFVATPEESWRVQAQVWARGMTEVGVFHSHLRHPANLSQIDYDLHVERFHDLWHMMVSMRTPQLPQVRAFAISTGRVREMRLLVADDGGDASSRSRPVTGRGNRNAAIARARAILELGPDGRPMCSDAATVLDAINGLVRWGSSGDVEEILLAGFLRDAGRRYAEHVAPQMQLVGGGPFAMGSDGMEPRHFCGESPRHAVELSPFLVARFAVTNELFGLLDPRRRELSAGDRTRPAVDVTWFDATLFAMWVGCRLPTEAEWELACGVGRDGEWSCGDESLLHRFAWYSENAHGEVMPVGTREANPLGLFDLHGNVWEWCQDRYDQDYYHRSPLQDPVHDRQGGHRVCRGGSVHALAEMCRTRYRFHEPDGFWAADLGLRLVRSPP
jgi:formylglycine-generating enzyme required for sulfatase activity/proteasome lid subunit RPN8/RPN11